MTKILSNQNSTRTDIALLIARVGIALLMLTHGLPKMFMLLSGDPIQFPPVLGMTPALSLGLVVFAEVVCSIFILLGLGTRLAAIPLIITMLVAVFAIHAADPFIKQEPGLQYLLVYVILLFGGSGKYSVDHLLQRNRTKTINAGIKIERSTFAIQ